jgi:hypothetical protein
MPQMDSTTYRAAIAALGLSQGGAARVLGVDARTSRRWALGEVPVPGTVQRLLWACAEYPGLLAALRDDWLAERPEPSEEP